ncbi:MAG TPA: hypothetical protein VGO68_12425 [Pyrinomonadaceae bacterium]|jgi:hypothetical protein|nr:hypothetical protein [Pyrinomonadaceae bacterium]
MSKHAHAKGRITSRKIRRLMLTGIIVAVFALGATAAVSLRSRQVKSATPPQIKAQTSDGHANLRYQVGGVPIDPQTGLVRPLTQEEAQRMAAGIKELVNQSTDGLQAVKQADGSVSIDLQGRFQNVAVAKRDENGNLVESCVDNRESAAEFFQIDPALVGVKKKPGAATTNNAAQKSEER